jgi:hypothetical protein
MGRLGNAWSTPSRIEGAVSVAVALVLATIALIAAGDHRVGIAWLGGAAIVALAGGIVLVSPVAVGGATAALGLACIVADAPAVPLYAVGLFVVAETALWSADDRLRFTEEQGPRRDRYVMLGAIASASVAIAGLLRLLSRDEGDGSKVYSIIAGVSITALAALITIGVRRLPSRS